YADYQCPACAAFNLVQFPDVKSRLVDAGRVRWVFRDLPLDIHPNAPVAAHAAACAADQGRYWEMQDALFQAQAQWSRMGSPMRAFRDMAQRLGLDAGAWDDCMKSNRHAGRIAASEQEAGR